jgi:hypothetical protein
LFSKEPSDALSAKFFLHSGRAALMVEIGEREGVGKRYVSRMIRLGFPCAHDRREN